MKTLPSSTEYAERRADVRRPPAVPQPLVGVHVAKLVGAGRCAAATVVGVRSRSAAGAGEEEGHDHHCLRPPRPRHHLGTERIGATSTEEFTVPTRTRRRFDDDDFDPPVIPLGTGSRRRSPTASPIPHIPTRRTAHRPFPTGYPPRAAATDIDLGVFKTGKEADVSLIRRTHGDHSVLLAAKQYRDAQHRLFHRDAGYLEGRRMRRSRENRAMATRTEFGRELIAGQWAAAEFAVLSRLWSAGAAVPYPVQLLGTELMMEFIGDADGVAAPRLAQLRPSTDEAAALYAQMREVLGATRRYRLHPRRPVALQRAGARRTGWC